MKFSALDVSTRLAIGFSIVFAGTMALAVAGWYGIQREAQLAEAVLDGDVAFIRTVANIRTQVQMLRRFEKDMLLVLPDVKKATEYKKQWDDVRIVTDDLFGIARKLAANDADRQRLDQVASAITGYSRGIEDVHASIVGGQIATSESGYKKVAEFRQQIRATEVLTGELFDSANKRMEAVKADLAATLRDVTLFLGIVAVTVLLLAASLGLIITRSITRQLGGEPAYAAEVAARIADGDLSTEVHLKAGDRASLLAALSRTVGQLAEMVGKIKLASNSLRAGSSEIAQGFSDLSSRTEEQASALEETSASMQQMTATVSQNAENASKANEFTARSSAVAARGGDAVREVVGTMSGISESSKRIADIIGVIDGIAFQTNILALNAAVEAARAGEQGRGFAVVAAEVRNLAQRSAAAAKEIKSLITASVSKVEAGSRQAAAAGKTVDEVVDSIKRVGGLVAEIAAASQEQSRGIEQVSETMTQMEKMTQQNAAMVEQVNAAAIGQDAQAGVLVQAVEKFKLQGERAMPAVMTNRTAASAAESSSTEMTLQAYGRQYPQQVRSRP